MSVIMTVFVLNLHHRGPNKHAVPHWLKIILLNKMSPYLCVQEDASEIGRFINTEEKFIKNVSLKITLDNIQQALQNESQLEQNNLNGPLRQAPVQSDQSIQGTNSPSFEATNQVIQPESYVVHRTLQPTVEQSPQRQCYNYYDPQTNEFNCQAGQQTQHISPELGRGQSKQQSTSQNRSENNRRTKRRSNSNLSKTNEEILNSLKRILEKHEKEDRDYEVIQEWRRVAQCVDRILFFIFLVATFTSTVAILVVAPATQ